MKKLIAFLFVLGLFGLFGQAEAVGAPYIYSAHATNITSTSASLNGVVNPNGSSSFAWYETPNGGPFGTVNIGSGNNNVNVLPYTLSGLTPNTTYQFRVVASNVNGITNGPWVYFTTTGNNNPPPPPPPSDPIPSVDLYADDTNIPYNSGTTIYWDTYEANSCTGSGGSSGWSGYKNPNGGTFYTGNLTQNTTFSITCSNNSGSDSDSVTVYVSQTPPPTPNPTVNLTANPMSVSYNGTSMLSWSTTNATSCNATGGSNGWSGPKNTSGTFYTGNLTNTTTYNITCTNSSLSATDSVTVYVSGQPYNPPTPAPTVNLFADESHINYNQSTTLHWATTNATSCNATGGMNNWAGYKNVNGSFYTGNLTYTATYTLTCTNSAGSTTDSVTVYVEQNYNNENPTVTTNSATNIDEDSARLNGYVDSNGGSVTVWFEYGTDSTMDNTTPTQYLGNTSGSSFNYSLFNLDDNETYYFRAVAKNTNGQNVYGSTRTFSLNCDNNCDNNGDKPEVTTDSATSIDENSATLNGEIELNDADSARVWFEYGEDRDDLDEDTDKMRVNDDEDFDERISGLRRNTTYYFRAVADSDEGIDRGSIKSFRTDNDGNTSSCSGTTCAPQAVTTLATNIGQTSARLNGLALINNNAFSTGYFEWGISPALGNVTAVTNVGNLASSSFYSSLFNLSSGTTYYYRAVVSNQYGISRGDITTFRTNSRTIINNNPSPTIIYRNTTVVENNTNGGIARPSLVFLDVNRDDEIIHQGEMVDYTITYQNISEEDLRDVVIQISLPSELEFLESTRGEISLDNNVVLVDIGNLDRGESGNVVVTTGVRPESQIGKTIVIAANLAYTIIDTDEQEEVFAYSKNTIESGGNVLGASTLFGTGFWPNSLLGWLILLLIILLIIWLARRAYNDRNRKDQHTTSNTYNSYSQPPRSDINTHNPF